MPNASLRAWKGDRPAAGSKASFRIASGVLAATSSISMPPAAEAMNTGLPWTRSSTMPRYSSRSMGSVSSISSRCTMRPAGPVWWVTSFMPSMLRASSAVSAASFATLTPPPLPRPPAWICAFTTTLPPICLAARSGLLHRERHLAARHRDVVLAQDGLGLILVNFHGNAVLVCANADKSI